MVPNHPAQLLTDIDNCNLANVTWVIPTAAESDHAMLNDGTGPQWVASIVNEVGNNPTCADGEKYWDDTVILITWDDWGGWYDHVQPFDITQPGAWGAGYTYGFRVPLLVVSAFTPAGTVSNDVHDFGTLVRFAENNFGLGFIGPADSILTQYADYQAASRPGLAGFFTLAAPRPFVTIPTSLKATDFIRAPKSSAPPDND